MQKPPRASARKVLACTRVTFSHNYMCLPEFPYRIVMENVLIIIFRKGFFLFKMDIYSRAQNGYFGRTSF